jgi:hypothetical protein
MERFNLEPGALAVVSDDRISRLNHQVWKILSGRTHTKEQERNYVIIGNDL